MEKPPFKEWRNHHSFRKKRRHLHSFRQKMVISPLFLEKMFFEETIRKNTQKRSPSFSPEGFYGPNLKTNLFAMFFKMKPVAEERLDARNWKDKWLATCFTRWNRNVFGELKFLHLFGVMKFKKNCWMGSFSEDWRHIFVVRKTFWRSKFRKQQHVLQGKISSFFWRWAMCWMGWAKIEKSPLYFSQNSFECPNWKKINMFI